jgi:hypothetical protein
MPTPFSSSALALLQASFLTIVLPRVLSHGRVYFRHVKCRDRRQDAIQEMIGLAWRWHLRLAERGKDATRFPTAQATYAARAVKSDRRLCGQEKSKDVPSPLAQRRHHFTVERLPNFSTLNGGPLEEAFHDNTKSPPDQAVCFKLDFSAWLTRLTERDGSIVEALMMGERTSDVAHQFGVSPARIAQKRREFCQDWRRFCGEGISTSRTHRPDVA